MLFIKMFYTLLRIYNHMLLTAVIVFLGVLFLFRPLQRNGFYILHAGIVILFSWYVESTHFKVSPFALKTFLLLYVYHLVSINIVTFVAYFVDKRAAQKGVHRIPEKNLHALEFLGGIIGAFAGQKILRHKTKKKEYKGVFIFLCFIQIGIACAILKYIGII